MIAPETESGGVWCLDGERMLTFECVGRAYALPIADVLEVAEIRGVTCVPTLPRSRGGVVNWHGDALPVVAPRFLLDVEADGDTGPASDAGEASDVFQVLVVSKDSDEKARLGLPIDRVLGLVDAGPRPSVRGDVVVERRSIDGRVVSVLDPGQLVARAAQLIERAVVKAAGPTGEPTCPEF